MAIINLKLKLLLMEKGISQRELAFRTRIDEGQLSKALKYGITTERLRQSVSGYLGVPAADIFNEPVRNK